VFNCTYNNRKTIYMLYYIAYGSTRSVACHNALCWCIQLLYDILRQTATRARIVDSRRNNIVTAIYYASCVVCSLSFVYACIYIYNTLVYKSQYLNYLVVTSDLLITNCSASSLYYYYNNSSLEYIQIYTNIYMF